MNKPWLQFLFFLLLLGLPGCNLPRRDEPALPVSATPLPITPAAVTPVPTLTPSATPLPPVPGRIVFTCQVFKVQAANQVCIMNADGSDFRRLTTDDGRQHFYPSLSPDGKSVLYAAFVDADIYDIFEYRLADGKVTPLTDNLGVLTSPEVSPDGQRIAFTRWTPNSAYAIWVMNRGGGEPHQVFGPPYGTGWDPTWSPDGQRILFSSDMGGAIQLYTIDLDGTNLQKITGMTGLRGRSDWSPDGSAIVTYAGEPWKREVYWMKADGSGLRQLSPAAGNSQGPSFSPDGQWVTFMSYFDHYGDDHGCEIYIMRLDGTDLRRLTDNDYCDYQPRWGP